MTSEAAVPLRESARATDGYELAVTRFPACGEPWASVAIAGAMGVRQEFYAPLARFLAAQGVHAITFDYRGIGASRRGPLRALQADVIDWARKDLHAVLDRAQGLAPALPLAVVGHSLGGQILGILPQPAQVRAALTVNAGSGWYRFNRDMWWRVRILWFAAVPLLTPLFGYFPGRRLRIVGDLPKGVALQWRRWCMHREYLLCEGERVREAFGRFRAPILAISFEDDEMITRAAVDEMHRHYRAAEVERRHLSPGEAGRRVGHFGFFAEASREGLWAPSLDWLRRALGPAQR